MPESIHISLWLDVEPGVDRDELLVFITDSIEEMVACTNPGDDIGTLVVKGVALAEEA